jgi:hypothetical protein
LGSDEPSDEGLFDGRPDTNRLSSSRDKSLISSVISSIRDSEPIMDLGRLISQPTARPIRKASWKDSYKGMNASLKESLNGPYAIQSRKAIYEEIGNMLSYHVGAYTNYNYISLGQRRFILRSFMFLKLKTKPDGAFDKMKARLVADGKHQHQALYDLIASAMVGLKGVFMLFNIASYYWAILASVDITGAFLNTGFTANDPTVRITIDKISTKVWSEVDPTCIPFITSRGELILTLDKFLYGLKQSPLKFQQHLTATLLAGGFTQLKQDECLFIKRRSNGFCLLSTHVDEILIVSTKQEMVDDLVKYLIKTYKRITYSPKADSYLGMTITRTQDLSHISISQRSLTDNIISTHPNLDCSSLRTPAG